MPRVKITPEMSEVEHIPPRKWLTHRIYLALRPYSLLQILVGPFFGTRANSQALENDRDSGLEDLIEVLWGHDPHSMDGC